MMETSVECGKTLRFPNTGLTIRVVDIEQNAVTIQVESKDEDSEGDPRNDHSTDRLSARTRHDIGNHLQAMRFGLESCCSEVESGLHAEAQETLAMLRETLDSLQAIPVLLPYNS